MSRDELEQKRHDLYADYVKAIGTPEEEIILHELDEMDAILDGDEEPQEDTTTHWDEYLLDLKIDMAREDALDYER